MVHCKPNLEFYQEIKHKVLDYLWDNKHAKIACDQLIADKSQGGIKLVDFTKKNTSLKITWVHIILHSKNDWVFVTYQFFSAIGSDIWKHNLDVQGVKDLITLVFWMDVLTEWSKIHYVNPINKQDILAMCIWYNADICINNFIILLGIKWYVLFVRLTKWTGLLLYI